MSFLRMEGLLEELRQAADSVSADMVADNDDNNNNDSHKLAATSPRATPTEAAELPVPWTEHDESTAPITLNEWRLLIQESAQELWTSSESREIWEFHGQDVDRIYTNWSAYTFVRFLALIKSNDRSRMQRAYQAYLDRFMAVRDVRKIKLRESRFEAGVEQYRALCGDPAVSDDRICVVIANELVRESESASLVYVLLRQRPDLFCRRA